MPGKLPPAKRRTIPILILVNQDENQRLRSFAAENGVSLAQVLRGSAMREVRKAERPKKTEAA